MRPGARADRLFIVHIVEAGEKIARFIDGLDEAAFAEDPRTLDAVIRNFEVMGEAAKRLSDETRRAFPSVPWREFARFRDVLIHRYDEIVPREVWRIATMELPPALEQARGAARDEGLL